MKYNEKLKDFEEVVLMSDEEVKRNNSQYNSLIVSIGYRIGGMNYFSGNSEPRCYYLSIKPASVNNGFRSYSMLGDGFDNGIAVVILPVNRYSRKHQEAIAQKVNAVKLARLYAANEREALQRELELIRK